jgi:AcrR family transcriptional regulator
VTVEGTVRTVTRRRGGRSARVRAAVMTAARQELAEYGYAGMSAARIADRAGVNRTTVHRRWPNLEDLVSEALLDSASDAIAIPDTGSVRGDLLLLLHEIARYIDSEPSRSMIRALVSDAARSAAIGDIVSQVWTTRFHLGEEVIVRGIARGELRDDLAPGTLLSTFTGPLYVRLLITDERIDAAFLDAVIDIGLDGARRSSSTRESA